VIHSNLGFDPSRDQLFANLHSANEFQSLVEEVRAQTPPVSHSRLIGIVPETDLFPENLAFDPATRNFLFGSTFKDEIDRCSQQGICEPFVPAHKDGLGYVLGLKIHQPSGTLWATSNTDNGASLHQYRLSSGELTKNYSVSGAHLFNDLAVSTKGDVYVTDTKEGSVYKVSPKHARLERFASSHVFTAANGIALSSDERTLFVASFGDGVSAIDLLSESVKPLPHPANVSLAYIDGLYAVKGSLIAIQNGPMVPRVVRFALNTGGNEIVAIQILERRNPFFDGITTGTVVGNQFYYVANSQVDKVVNGKIKAGAKLDPLRILAITL
jgi:SMP-30/Gluconolactonase/LRE-like region